MNFTRLVLTSPLLLMTMACSSDTASPSEPEAAIENGIKWHQISDGSYISRRLSAPDLYTGASIRRCWQDVTKFDCISVNEYPADAARGAEDTTGNAMFYAFRYQEKNLEQGHEVPEVSGYSCEFYTEGMVIEHMANEHGYLATNQLQVKFSAVGGILISPNGEEWSSEFKTSFMRENAIAGMAGSFDCTAIAKAVLDSSIETVGSTAISKSILDS